MPPTLLTSFSRVESADPLKSLLLFILGATSFVLARLSRRRLRDLDGPDLPVMQQPNARDQIYLIQGKSAWALEILAAMFFVTGIVALFD